MTSFLPYKGRIVDSVGIQEKSSLRNVNKILRDPSFCCREKVRCLKNLYLSSHQGCQIAFSLIQFFLMRFLLNFRGMIMVPFLIIYWSLIAKSKFWVHVNVLTQSSCNWFLNYFLWLPHLFFERRFSRLFVGKHLHNTRVCFTNTENKSKSNMKRFCLKSIHKVYNAQSTQHTRLSWKRISQICIN